MSRVSIRSKDISVMSDNGSVLFSVLEGEQIRFNVTLVWMNDLSDYTIEGRIIESKNVEGDGENVPFEEKLTPVVKSIPIIDEDPTDNVFSFVIPKDLTDNWNLGPKPSDPVYGFMAISVSDNGVGYEQQIIVPLKGLIEIEYNPLRTIA